MILSLPNLPLSLTLIRLVIAPCSIPFLIVHLSPYNAVLINLFVAACFVFFGLTDFFDGYFARKYNQQTVLGAILDPLADKFLMYSALIGLLVVGKIYYYWVLIFIGREFFVMGLRHIALEHTLSLRVCWSAKIKTFFQFSYITVALLNPYQAYGLSGAPYWNGIQTILLALALCLSVLSGYQYYRTVVNAYRLSGSKARNG
ncbi:CDP-diacylglycerol--glycerol-3-phosphate 3-phosphatidyltransferase [Candidatus Dependentiae bacterium]|nr:CDP-diacylglycerol--glycerol-3-phosphate 3-phosphatidyltransferase [Candidatus Dependentiae bacterium]